MRGRPRPALGSARLGSRCAATAAHEPRGRREVGPARPGTTGSGRLQVPLCAGHGAGLCVVAAGTALGVTLKQHGLRRLAVAVQPQHTALMLRRTTRSDRRGARAHGRSLPPQRACRPRLRLRLRLRRAAGRRAALLACEGLCLGQCCVHMTRRRLRPRLGLGQCLRPRLPRQ
eukprot:scaffold33461_cov54-Phaeocystis_antarctica.AAC.1